MAELVIHRCLKSIDYYYRGSRAIWNNKKRVAQAQMERPNPERPRRDQSEMEDAENSTNWRNRFDESKKPSRLQRVLGVSK
jgi:hypothetical protein